MKWAVRISIAISVAMCLVSKSEATDYGEIEPKKYAVRLESFVNEAASPPTITISWPKEGLSSNSDYKVYRKTRSSEAWGSQLTGTITATQTAFQYVDSVALGDAFEYQVIQENIPGTSSTRKAYGYIYAGIKTDQTAAMASRGKLILMVEQDLLAYPTFVSKLDTLEADIIADGWQIIRLNVPRGLPDNSSDPGYDRVDYTNQVHYIKNLIRSEYLADPSNVKAVFLLGHIAVPYSGDYTDDGHDQHQGAQPSDLYYVDVDGPWTDSTANTGTPAPTWAWNVNTYSPQDGKFDQNEIPIVGSNPGVRKVELQIGRVDFSRFVNWGVSEVGLYERYLTKNHKYRTADPSVAVARRGLIFDWYGDEQAGAREWAPAAMSWRAFPAFFGNGTTAIDSIYKDWSKTFLGETTGTKSYLWATMFSTSPGETKNLNGLGGSGSFIDYSTQFATHDVKAVFTSFCGSYIGDWDNENNLLRGALGSSTYTLASIYGGIPHWFLHPMALGETIGEVTMLNQNNTLATPLYNHQRFIGRSRVHVALLGDPTLRLHVVDPPEVSPTYTVSGSSVTIYWTGSLSSAIQGYNVYRSLSKYGPFKKVNTTLLPANATSYQNTSVPKGIHTYMVRAVKKEGSVSGENMGSGTYLNMSQGAYSPGIDVPNGVAWNFTQFSHVFTPNWSTVVAINNDPVFEAAGYTLTYPGPGVDHAVRYQGSSITEFPGYWHVNDKTWSSGISDYNVIAGTIDKYDSVLGYGHTVRGFRWGPSQSTFSILDPLSGGLDSRGSQINSWGTVAGFGRNSSGVTRALYWPGNSSTPVDLWSLVNSDPSHDSYAYGINSAGYIVGKSKTSTINQKRAFLTEPELRIDPDWSDLGTFSGNSEAYDINNREEIVGASQIAREQPPSPNGPWRGFLIKNEPVFDSQLQKYVRPTTRIDPPSGTADTFAYGINDSGVVVGTWSGNGIIWQEGMSTARDLNTYKSSSLSFTISAAEDINNNMVIVGWGYDGSGNRRGFILTPP